MNAEENALSQFVLSVHCVPPPLKSEIDNVATCVSGNPLSRLVEKSNTAVAACADDASRPAKKSEVENDARRLLIFISSVPKYVNGWEKRQM